MLRGDALFNYVISSNRLLPFSIKFLSSLEYLLEGILIGVLLLLIIRNDVGEFALLHITETLLFAEGLKLKGICLPSKFTVIDWCLSGNFSPMITSLIKLLNRVNPAPLLWYFSFPNTSSARTLPLKSGSMFLSANGTVPWKWGCAWYFSTPLSLSKFFSGGSLARFWSLGGVDFKISGAKHLKAAPKVPL